MRLDPNPIFRKVILPWYDSNTICVLMVLLMLAVILFGISGIAVAYEHVEYHDFVWVPILIIILSSMVILSTLIRLIRRHAYQIKQRS